MLRFIIPLLGTYLSSDLTYWIIYPLVCLGFIYIFPSFVRSLFSWR